MGHYVYKYVNNNEIIYIGKTNGDLHTRIKAHGKPGDNIPKEAWSELNIATIYYTELYNANMTDFVESELIRRYNPKWNRAKKEKYWSGLPIGEPEWNIYAPLEKEMVDTPGYMMPPYTTSKLRILIKRFNEDWDRWVLLKLIENTCNKYDFKNNKSLQSDIAELNISRYFAISNSFYCNPALILIDPRKKIYIPSKSKYIAWCYQIYHNTTTGDMYAAISKRESNKYAQEYRESMMFYKSRICKVLDVMRIGYLERIQNDDLPGSYYRIYKEKDFKRKYALFEDFRDDVLILDKLISE